ncbi:MAG: PrsW family glutamic-type intramembrane protease [Thermoplasmata archaeon]
MSDRMALQFTDVLVLLAAAFVPSLVYLVWIRNTERYGREPYSRLLRIFAYGAVISVIIAVVIEAVLIALLNMNFERVTDVLGHNPNLGSLLLAVIIAPFAEEFTKSIGVLRNRRFIAELEDGIVFGAAAGLGFAATENLLYEGNAYFSDGAKAFIATTIIRSLSSALLHASSTSVVGLGIARSTRQGKSWFPYYLAGVAMHGIFNLAASFGSLSESKLGPSAYLIGLVAAFAIAVVGISVVRAKIRYLDRQQPRYG